MQSPCLVTPDIYRPLSALDVCFQNSAYPPQSLLRPMMRGKGLEFPAECVHSLLGVIGTTGYMLQVQQVHEKTHVQTTV